MRLKKTARLAPVTRALVSEAKAVYSYQYLSRVSAGLLLLGSSMLGRAAEAPVPAAEPPAQASSEPDTTNTAVDTAALNEALQTAQSAIQAAQQDAGRIESAALPKPAMPAGSTGSNSAGSNGNPATDAATSSSVPSGPNPSGLNQPADTPVTEAPTDAQAAAEGRQEARQADAMLDSARVESQIATDSATAENTKQDEVAGNTGKTETAKAGQDAKTSATPTPAIPATTSNNDTATVAQAEKPGFLKRLWYRFRPPQEDLAPAMPTIKVKVEGAPELLAKNIKGKLEQYTVEAFSDFRASLPQLRSMAKDASEAVGYYSAEFRFEQIDKDDLRVIVTPHDPVKVNSQNIVFAGEATEDRSFQDIKNNPDLKVGEQMNDQLYEQTKGRISSTATDRGYFDGYWNIHDVKVTLPENKADITLDYDSGARYKLGKVEFKNTDPDKPVPVDMDLLEKLVPFQENEDYAAWKINNLSRNLSDTRYFSNIQVETVIPDPIVKPLKLPDGGVVQTDATRAAANPDAQVQAAPAAMLAAAPPLDESQFAGLGDQHPAQYSAELKQQLTDAERAELEKKELAAKVREIRVIPVVVSVNADKPNTAEAGIGYGTDTGVRFRTQYRKALVNSHGHNIDSNLEISQIRQAVDVRYNMPYKHPLDDTISVFGGFEQEKNGNLGDQLGLTTQSVTLGAERAIKPKNGDWQHTMSVRYRLDQLKRETGASVNPEDFPPPFNIANSRFEQQSLLFGYGVNKVYSFGNRLNPPRAFRQFYQVDVGTKSLLTDTDLAILRAGWRFIYSYGENDNHQFVGRADAATILTKSFEDVPYNLRFFAGGDQSIRGYDYKSLSTLQNGYLIGGQNLAVGSLEYNYQFIPKWRGAVFVDGGNAFDKQFNDPIKVGAGLGIRWASPVGPIRVDVAAGVSETHVPIRLHFFIGPQL